MTMTSNMARVRSRNRRPAQARAISGAHTETDDERGLGLAVVKSQRQVGHQFGDWGQLRHAQAVDDQDPV